MSQSIIPFNSISNPRLQGDQRFSELSWDVGFDTYRVVHDTQNPKRMLRVEKQDPTTKGWNEAVFE